MQNSHCVQINNSNRRHCQTLTISKKSVIYKPVILKASDTVVSETAQLSSCSWHVRYLSLLFWKIWHLKYSVQHRLFIKKKFKVSYELYQHKNQGLERKRGLVFINLWPLELYKIFYYNIKICLWHKFQKRSFRTYSLLNIFSFWQLVWKPLNYTHIHSKKNGQQFIIFTCTVLCVLRDT